MLRPKSQWTEGGALQSILKSTGLVRKELVPDHTKKAYRWRIR